MGIRIKYELVPHFLNLDCRNRCKSSIGDATEAITRNTSVSPTTVNKLWDRFGESWRRKLGALRAPDDESSNFSWHRCRDNVFIFQDLLLDDGVVFASQK